MSGAASVALLGHSWSGRADAVKLTIGGLVALAGLLVGESVTRIGGAGAKRQGGLLWLCGTGGAAQAVAEVVRMTGAHREGTSLLLVGFTVMTIGVVLWRNEDRPLRGARIYGSESTSVNWLRSRQRSSRFIRAELGPNVRVVRNVR